MSFTVGKSVLRKAYCRGIATTAQTSRSIFLVKLLRQHALLPTETSSQPASSSDGSGLESQVGVANAVLAHLPIYIAEPRSVKGTGLVLALKALQLGDRCDLDTLTLLTNTFLSLLDQGGDKTKDFLTQYCEFVQVACEFGLANTR